MPIKSLTTRQARFPMLGKIRKGGEKKENPKRPGTLISGDDLEYFRIDSDIQGINEKFTAIYGVSIQLISLASRGAGGQTSEQD
jgi:hypothetical protein